MVKKNNGGWCKLVKRGYDLKLRSEIWADRR